MRDSQFVNNRLLLERRVTSFGATTYELSDITIPSQRFTITFDKQEWEEINRIIEREFEIYTKEEKQEIDDDIPF